MTDTLCFADENHQHAIDRTSSSYTGSSLPVDWLTYQDVAPVETDTQLPACTRIGPLNRQDALSIQQLLTEADEDDTIAGLRPLSQGWRTHVVERLDSLASLPGGWNGHSARPIDRETIEKGLDLLDHLLPPSAPPPQVVPTVHGGFQVEWDCGCRHLEIDLTAFPFVEYAYEDDCRDDFKEGVALADLRELSQLIRLTFSD